MVNLLFRHTPPKDFVEGVLRTCGLSAGLQDFRWFSKGDLSLEHAGAWLPELEAYYYPCKARRFFYGKGDPNPDLLITVIRHMLGAHGYELRTREAVAGAAGSGKKQTLYQITPRNPFQDLSGVTSYEVLFT
jgi:hypothetical protein